MKRSLSVLSAAALVLSLAAVAAAREDKNKDKPAPAKDKADDAAQPKDKAKEEAKAKPAATPDLASATPYYPLQVGNTWYYKIADNKYSLKVAKYEKVGDVECARVEMIVEDQVKVVEDITVTKDGVARVAYDGKRAEPPLVFLKLPFQKDQTWEVNTVVGKTDKSPGEKVTGTLKAGEAPKVQVPAGTYDTITVTSQNLQANGMPLNFTYYFAKGMGMVKQEIDVSGQKVVIELEKFEPAKQ